MSIFRRKSAPTTVEPVTALLCQERGCANYNAAECAYRDRRGRACRATFCPEHSVVFDNARYCRRHAGTMRALGSRGQVRSGLPDLNNRGPSLVNFICGHLDATVTALLQSIARPEERVLGDSEVTMAFDPDRNPRWERSWKLVESTGVVVKVTAFVEEKRDSVVTVRVGSELVAEGVPPWIQHRMNGDKVAPEVEQSERALFYRYLEENITAAVNQVRERSDHPTWV
ncbi:MAG: hypothetical protein JOY80_00145 [Candidatus Dormibacteraeota bacterium]|nr:hypothetical protein [Candidatus Dormibacteraeota bacterium]